MDNTEILFVAAFSSILINGILRYREKSSLESSSADALIELSQLCDLAATGMELMLDHFLQVVCLKSLWISQSNVPPLICVLIILQQSHSLAR